MEPHRGAPRGAEALPLVAVLVVDQVFLDGIERFAKLVGNDRDRIGEVADDRLQQRHGVREALAGVDRLQRPLDGAERIAAAADDQCVGERKAQAPELAVVAFEFPQQVGEHAGNAALDRLEEEMVVLGQEDCFCALRERRLVLDPASHTGLGQREMQPDPAAGLRQGRPKVRRRDALGDPLTKSIGKAQPREFAGRRLGGRSVEHASPPCAVATRGISCKMGANRAAVSRETWSRSAPKAGSRRARCRSRSR